MYAFFLEKPFVFYIENIILQKQLFFYVCLSTVSLAWRKSLQVLTNLSPYISYIHANIPF